MPRLSRGDMIPLLSALVFAYFSASAARQRLRYLSFRAPARNLFTITRPACTAWSRSSTTPCQCRRFFARPCGLNLNDRAVAPLSALAFSFSRRPQPASSFDTCHSEAAGEESLYNHSACLHRMAPVKRPFPASARDSSLRGTSSHLTADTIPHSPAPSPAIGLAPVPNNPPL